MTMIRFTYDDGEDVVSVVWTPEYGFMAAAGSRALLDRVTYEEIAPRTPSATLIGHTATERPIPILGIVPDEGVDGPDECAACGCTEADHGKIGCEAHDCRAFIP